MATLAEIGALADRSTADGAAFALRVNAAMLAAAHAVANESPTTADRQQWASVVLTTGADGAETGRFVRYVLGNATVAASGAAAPDSDIQFVVNSLVTVLVGAVS